MNTKRFTAIGFAAAMLAAAALGTADSRVSAQATSTVATSTAAQTVAADVATPSPVHGEMGDDAVELSKKCKCPNGCQMKKWMKKVMQRAMGSGDNKKIAAALGTIAKKPVPGYDKWVAISKAGQKAALAGDKKGIKKSCKDCHKAYQKKYRKDKALRCGPW